MLNSMGDVTKPSISHAFYTYAHINPTTNKIFYIGKGKANRVTQIAKRNQHWKNIVAKYGFKPEILSYWNSEQAALDHEELLISCFRDMGYKLANLSDGGEGAAGVETSLKSTTYVTRSSGQVLGRECADHAGRSYRDGGHLRATRSRGLG